MDANPIIDGLDAVTKKWTKQRKAEERSHRSLERRETMWMSARTSLKDICYRVMAVAWNLASDNGRLPTHWRQIFYRARPLVADHPDSDRPLTDTYFKGVLEQYLLDYQPGWDVLRGARGVFKEPHRAENDSGLPLSTLDVRNYLRQGQPSRRISPQSGRFPTAGATHRFGAILICEKEGFDLLLEADGLPNRYDLGLMSTKGISARAARDLASKLEVPCLVLHDMDKNGFVMASGFPSATDIGIRIADVEEWELEPEAQTHQNWEATYNNLIKNGASPDEAQFIADGQRVELNMLTGPQFIEFVETKLDEHGVAKVIPDPETLEDAWRRAHLIRAVNGLIEQTEDDQDGTTPPAPADLAEQIKAALDDDPDQAWDDALRTLTQPDQP